jgi:hypothetical protein
MTDNQLPDINTVATIFGILCFSTLAAWVTSLLLGE